MLKTCQRANKFLNNLFASFSLSVAGVQIVEGGQQFIKLFTLYWMLMFFVLEVN